jgi:iron complex outermembrane receptor protein
LSPVCHRAEFESPDLVNGLGQRRQEDDGDVAGLGVPLEPPERSGVTSIPEALRLVPGVEVARVDSQRWAISTRGFNNILANKLLVLIDGRTVYSPLFSGVRWEVQDLILEDIDRIEVIRGPDASVWSNFSIRRGVQWLGAARC